MRKQNSKLLYYWHAILNYLYPHFLLDRKWKENKSAIYDSEEWTYIQERVDYYNKLSSKIELPECAPTLSEHVFHKKKGNSVYFFDTYEIIRFFPRHLKWLTKAGDVTELFKYPTVVKSRPIAKEGINNSNSIILKLDKVRHFFFVKDSIPFEKKKAMILFRGAVKGKPHRQRFRNVHRRPFM